MTIPSILVRDGAPACPNCGGPMGLQRCTVCHWEPGTPARRHEHLATRHQGKCEDEIQLAMKRWLGMAGFEVVDTSQGRRTRVTEGLSDLIALGHGLTLFVEVKTLTGRQSKDQKRFEGWVDRGGRDTHYLLARSLDGLQKAITGLIRERAA